MLMKFGYKYRGPGSGKVRGTLICSYSTSYRLSPHLLVSIPISGPQPGNSNPPGLSGSTKHMLLDTTPLHTHKFSFLLSPYHP